MSKLRIYFLMSSCFYMLQTPVVACEVMDSTEAPAMVSYTKPDVEEALSTTDIMTEVVLRPVSALGSLTGLSLFIVASPFSALANLIRRCSIQLMKQKIVPKKMKLELRKREMGL